MNTYSLVLAFHVISIATWMIMLVYLPKLFVYHINAPHYAQATIALQETESLQSWHGRYDLFDQIRSDLALSQSFLAQKWRVKFAP